MDLRTFGGPPSDIHLFLIDGEGDFYTAEVDTGRVQKFRPLPDANPRYLVGPDAGSRSNGGLSRS